LGISATAYGLGAGLFFITLATLAALPIRAGIVDTGRAGFTLFRGDGGDVAGYFLASIVFWNLLLAAFNLIPVAPLDGFKVAVGLLPRDLSRSFAKLEQYGPIVLIALIALPFLTGGSFGILFEVMSPPIEFLAKLFAGIEGDAFG
ncbi:MAG: hypothetical protein IH957_08210, partial [Chloroflexi bacterium]|nr:hypothetical protein [Chloroflexota bacterium]